MKRKRNIFKLFRMFTAAAVLTAFVLHLAGIVRIPGIFRTQAAPDLLSFLSDFSLGAGAALLIILLLTAIFGRIYCSVLCPLGILQDVMSLFRFRRRYRYAGWKKYIRAPFFWLVAGLALAGFMLPLTLLLPSSLFVSMFNASGGVEVVRLGWAARITGYAVSVLVFLAVLWKGRIFCNTLCPVGAVLAFVARHSRYRISLDTAKCVRCGACEKVCKSTCINAAEQRVANEECVMCMNCISSCALGAVSVEKKSSGVAGILPGRRDFLLQTGALAGGVIAGSAAKLSGRKSPVPVMPPGAGNPDRFTARCVGCGLCISVCKGNVLRPALTEYGLRGFLQPVLDPFKGACDFNCSACSNVCPCGALSPLPLKEKQRTRIGLAVYKKELCVAYKNGEDCGACAEHCPVGALEMIEYRDTMIPQVNTVLCIGCGACQNICPVRPEAAIMVNGVATQTLVEKPKETESKSLSAEEDFPF
ncbi:MAG: 4Fe-4S binding protein [Lentisphaeria bacterium]|nr:4Fe-4S binding protein [Lentisphaeria bacterium]